MKVSIRFFDDREVRAVWDDEHAKWWFSVVDVVGVLNEEPPIMSKLGTTGVGLKGN